MQRFAIICASVLVILGSTAILQAEDTVIRRGSQNSADIQVNADQYLPPSSRASQEAITAYGQFDPIKYTLGPNDVVEIEIMRHPEFSGKFAINQEGKLQYKFVGDMDVQGLTKKELEEKLKTALTEYVVSPEVNVTIIEYGSKVFYVMGEVVAPGQFVMKSEGISVRDAIHLAGLPTTNASMRRCRLITPSENGKSKTKKVNLYELLYEGDLKQNIIINPGDILYVPATVVAKVIRVISPVATTVGLSASPVESAASGKTAFDSLKKNKAFYQ